MMIVQLCKHPCAHAVMFSAILLCVCMCARARVCVHVCSHAKVHMCSRTLIYFSRHARTHGPPFALNLSRKLAQAL